MAKKEYIADLKNHDDWFCLCGNTTAAQGFYPCDMEGNAVDLGRGWKDLYACEKCGRIIKETALEVVGRRKRKRKRKATAK